MKRRTQFIILILAGLAFLVGFLRYRSKPISTKTDKKIQGDRSVVEPVPIASRPEAVQPVTPTAGIAVPPVAEAALVQSFPTPSPADRPYIRVQINPDGSLQGVFATRCEPIKQARALEAQAGYYYRLVSPTTGETLLDGVVAKPILRQQRRGEDKGVPYIKCDVTPLDQPVFFDLPNVAARLEVYATTPQSSLVAKYLPLVKAVNLTQP